MAAVNPVDLLEPTVKDLGRVHGMGADTYIQLSIAVSLKRIADQLNGNAPGYNFHDAMLKLSGFND